MDGNNRWARARGLPGAEGHRAGEQAVHDAIRACAEQGVQVVTLYAFSSENWRRPEEEVSHLMSLFLRALNKRVQELHEKQLRIRFIGERSAFSQDLQLGMESAEQLTAGNQRMTVVVAVNYGGQWDIAEAAKAMARRVAAGELLVDQITAESLGVHIALADLPPPDLLIRTGGEQRLSNFLLWQAAYSELWFTPILWPDFDAVALQEALDDYAGRQRRFGRSGDDAAVKKGESEC
ncbi:MAG: di-trans,poly-cis-decaprenylcistransferase [Gammaproteobacteria bacterium HGW-Gammaproteobacteria-14]|nr:MAG: di-trans,poly-cis-decaprenylcistransferase [Gammaproteobacteria bacterium HGW-Gammaproteobacteria-14]